MTISAQSERGNRVDNFPEKLQLSVHLGICLDLHGNLGVRLGVRGTSLTARRFYYSC